MSKSDKKIFTIIAAGLIIVVVGGYLLISFLLSKNEDNDVNNIANNINNPSDNKREEDIIDVVIDRPVEPGGNPSEKIVLHDERTITETTLPGNTTIDEKIE